jgi:hypothetical protein
LFFVLFHQPTLHGINENGLYYKRRLLFTINKIKQKKFYKQTYLSVELNLFFQTTYAFFIMCALYCNTFLPYGRFYNRLGGNIGMLGAYFYVFLYLSITSLRRPYWLELYFYFIFNKSNFLKRSKVLSPLKKI